MVPKNLTIEQEIRRNNCLDLLDRIANVRDFCNSGITGELWIFEYDPETKRQSEEWHTANSPRPKRNSNEQIEQINNDFFKKNGESPTKNLFLQDKLSTKFL
ncbi:HTH_48 domain-containing protein [Trichonephila clavipes]|nr:HTH_48 domain-containing protein [Trichonephila clavipes]